MNPHRLKAYFYLLIVVAIWGIAGPIIKLTLGVVPWDILLLYRFFITSIVFIPFIHKQDFHPLKKGNIFFLAFIYMIFNTTIGFALLFAGTARTSLLSMNLISLFGPILTIFGGYFFLKDKISWIEKIGMGITFFGSLLLIVEPLTKSDGVQGEIGGNIMIIGSLIAGAISAVLLKELLRKGVNAVFLANIGFVVGLLTMIPIALHFHSLTNIITTVSTIPLKYHLGIVYLAVFSGTIAYSLNNIAQKSIEVSELAVFSYLYPIISAVLAVWFLKEHMTSLAYFGAGVTMVGIFITEIKRRAHRVGLAESRKRRYN